MNIDEVRKKFPQYDGVPDDALLKGVYDKYYSNKMPIEQFMANFESAPQESPPTQQQEYYGESVTNDRGQFQVGNTVNPEEQAFVKKYVENPVAGAVEGAAAMGTGAVASVYAPMVGGIAALRQRLKNFVGSPETDLTVGSQAMNDAAQKMTYQPRSEGGQQFLQGVGSAVESLTDNAVGDWARDRVTGERALTNASADGQPRTNGRGQYVVGGEMGGEFTGRMMEMTPSLTQAALVATGMPGVQSRAPVTTQTTIDGASAEFTRPGWQKPPKVAPGGRIESVLDDMGQIKESLIKGRPDPKAALYKLDDAKNVVDDPVAIKAKKTGWNENVIEITKAAAKNPQTQSIGIRMVKEARDGLKNLEYGASNRPSGILGESVMPIYRFLKTKLSKTGGQIDDVARKTLPQQVEGSQRVIGKINDKIAEWGGTWTDEGGLAAKPGTPLFGKEVNLKNLEIISKQASALGNSPSGFQIHKFKQWMNDFISERKMGQSGATGDTQRFLAKYYDDINEMLRKSASERPGAGEYTAINEQYRALKTALDDMGTAFGEKRLTGPSAEEATGGIMRKWISNAPNRGPLMDAFRQAEKTAIQYGGKSSGPIEPQILMANALDDLMIKANPLVRSSFKADITAATMAQPKNFILDKTAGKLANYVETKMGRTNMDALNAMDDILRSTSK